MATKPTALIARLSALTKLNPSQIKCLGVFTIFAVIGFGPISPGCLIGMYVVGFRPDWFWTLANELYADLPKPQWPVSADDSKQARKKCFLSLLGLFILDIAPVPITPVIAFFIITIRPLWLYRLIIRIYENTQAS